MVIQILAVILTLGSIVLALTAFNLQGKGKALAHKTFGLILLILVVLQGLMAIFSPKKYRK